MLTEFDSDRFFLGKLCKNQHEWEQSGKSLRYLSCGDNRCVQCNKEQSIRYRQSHHNELLERRREKSAEKYARNRDKNIARSREYYQNNSERVKERGKEYRLKNKDRCREYSRQYRNKEENKIRQRANWSIYYQNNKEKYILRAALWEKANRHKCKIRCYKRRSKLKTCHSVPYSKAELSLRYEQFSGCCAYCGTSDKVLTNDHLVAISKGGSDVISNIVPACISCNCSKRHDEVKIWFKKQPFYSRSRWLKILKILGKSEFNLTQIPLF